MITRGRSLAGRRRANGLAPLLCAIFISALNACSSQPVVETITTDAGRASALPANARAVALEPNLPARDPDVETAGDRIAEAITYLNTRRRDRREVALRALNQAEAAINKALRNEAQDENVKAALRAALRDLEAGERAVQHNAPDAPRQLTFINKQLDGIGEKQKQ